MVELLNTRDVARTYHVTSATVLNWIRAGKLKAYTTPGGHYRVAREDLEAFSRDYGYSPAEGIPTFGLRLLFVGSDAPLFERLRDAVRFRWPAAQIEQARTEFEIGWWMARMRPTHLVVLNLMLSCADPATRDLPVSVLTGGAVAHLSMEEVAA